MDNLIKRFDAIEHFEGLVISIALQPKKIYIKIEKEGVVFWTTFKSEQYRLRTLCEMAKAEWDSLN